MKTNAQFKPLLILLIFLLVTSPVLMVHAANRSALDSILIPPPGHQPLQDKIIQNCSITHQCALHFNGENQWVKLEQFHGFDTVAFTVETWFIWSGTGTAVPAGHGSFSDGIPFLTIGDGEGPTSGTAANLFFGIQASTGKLMAVFTETPSSAGTLGQSYPIFGDSTISPDSWHHAAATYDGQTWSLYLDGRLDANLTYATPIMPKLIDSRHAFLAAIFSNTGKSLGYYKGDLDEVRIWETARTQDDILTSANLGDVSDPRLIGQWNMNEGSGIELYDSSSKGIQGIVVNNSDWTDGAPFNLSSAPISESNTGERINSPAAPNADSIAPNPPTMISPANGATEVSIPPTLNVSVSDPDTSSLTVSFYGRAAPGSSGPPDFTIVALPDTQMYTANDTGIFENQTQWIANHLISNNIAFVTHLGDMVNDYNISDEWDIADTAMSILESAAIPYGITVGNCDMSKNGVPPDPSTFNLYFPYSRFTGRPYYGGAYNNNNANSYQLFSVSGMDFIVIHFEFNVSSDPNHAAIMNWADNLLKTNSTRRAIVVTHDLLSYSSTFDPDGSLIYNELKDNPNLFLLLGGHLDDEGRRQDLGTDGHTIYSLRSDYQDTRPNGGNGLLRLLVFSPDTNKINVFTYSPYVNQYETDSTSQFSLDYNMNGTSFQLIGPPTNVPSGTSTNVIWPSLALGTQYQWYATVDDGTSVATGPTWSFTTTNIPAAPVITLQPSNQTVNAGQIATYSAAASGSPSPTVQWQVSTDNGSTWSNISLATSAVYTLTAQISDSGKQFRAIFTNVSGSATTNPAILTVYEPPVVTTHPSNQIVNAGQTATFTSAANGNPTPSIQWQTSTDGTSWTPISGATSTTYTTLPTVAADNGKRYRAVFTNVAGSTNSNPAILTVNYAPTVTIQPANQTRNEGQTATFTSAASGNPTPTVKWQVSTDNGLTWQDISGATSTTYSFTAQAGDNSKQYRAIFTNSIGSATSNAATLTVNTIPVITTHPSNLTVNAGQSASFTANATGNPAPIVQWQVSTNNGTTWSPINGESYNNYIFTAQIADNGKQYRAVFTNVAGSTNSNPAILTVNYAPTVTTHPANQTKNAGQTASFTSAASGNPTPTVQWQVSPNGADWSSIAGATSTTYSFSAQSTDNGNRYRAVFTNLVSTANSNPAILTVNTGPVITLHPVNQSVTAGQTATFTAASNGNPAPTVQWQVSTNHGSTWTNISGATSTTYSFTAHEADDGKQYHAVFTNSAGSATTDPATLSINKIPVITIQPSDLSLTAWHTASFTAGASGIPTPSVQWQVSSNSGNTWTNISGATSTTYTFTAQATDNGKQYRAIFTNLGGSATSRPALLTINYYFEYLTFVHK